MCNITLLFSFHSEFGNCNPLELYKIIDKISPDVIFEELDINSYNDHYGQEGPYSTETIAISKYLQYKSIQHIPVDTYDMKNFTKDDKIYMDTIIANNSIEYCNILEKQMKLLHSIGYRFLNGEECSAMSLELQKIEKYVQERLFDNKLTNIYKKWIEINNERENEMIKNIIEFCKNNVFNKGLLIAGADHKISLTSKLQNYCNNDIKWNYFFK
jgi:hypothetical protein